MPADLARSTTWEGTSATWRGSWRQTSGLATKPGSQDPSRVPDLELALQISSWVPPPRQGPGTEKSIKTMFFSDFSSFDPETHFFGQTVGLDRFMSFLTKMTKNIIFYEKMIKTIDFLPPGGKNISGARYLIDGYFGWQNSWRSASPTRQVLHFLQKVCQN